MLVYGSYIQVPNLGVTLFDSYSYDGVSAGIWVRHTGPKSGCKLMMLFGTYSYDGVSAGIWVGHPYRSEIWGRAGDFFFLTVIFIMVSMHAVVVVAIRLRN